MTLYDEGSLSIERVHTYIHTYWGPAITAKVRNDSLFAYIMWKSRLNHVKQIIIRLSRRVIGRGLCQPDYIHILLLYVFYKQKEKKT